MAIQTAATIPVKTIVFNPHYVKTKRLFDIVFSLFVLLPLGLVVGIVAIAIRFDSEGPIFYRQKRVGRYGLEFDMLKIRSMYVNSDDKLHREAVAKYMAGHKLQEATETGTELCYKKQDDPRITRVGRLIRKFSIDELPQFFNVLRGEMTLVGPRPPLPYEVEHYGGQERMRLLGKPGLTGTWQVYGRSRVPFQSMVAMDIEYLQRQSFWYDLKLIALTVPIMLLGRGGA